MMLFPVPALMAPPCITCSTLCTKSQACQGRHITQTEVGNPQQYNNLLPFEAFAWRSTLRALLLFFASQERVDRKLVGGFILEFEDRLVDMSVRKKLEEFNALVFKLETDLRA
jgi:hypothetical protein